MRSAVLLLLQEHRCQFERRMASSMVNAIGECQPDRFYNDLANRVNTDDIGSQRFFCSDESARSIPVRKPVGGITAAS